MFLPKRGDKITCMNGHLVLKCVEDCERGLVRSSCFERADGSPIEPHTPFESCHVAGCGAPWFRYNTMIEGEPIGMHVEGKGWTNATH